MAEAVKQGLGTSFEGMSNLPILRQIGLLVGLAASIALGISIVIWSQTPQYSLLYSGLAGSDASQVVQALENATIPYKIDRNNGAILVAGDNVHRARLELAGQGLPKGGGVGYEMLQGDQSFGTSRFIENARFQRALEIELARSISDLKGVRSARVHLAAPKQSVFVRKSIKPSASILLNLYAGRVVKKDQVNAIVHLVSASVPGMDSADVKVIDQNGVLLSGNSSDSGIGLTNSQFEYSRQLERSYIKRIEDILTPIVGEGGVRAQVVADVDFTITERTSESFNPDLPAIRSEQTSEDSSSTGAGAVGVPGAASNQPGAEVQAGDQQSSQTGNTSRRSTRNYELDKTVSHTRLATGTLKRLSVAIVLDNKKSVDEDGEATVTPLAAEEIDRLTQLVKEAVGFNAQRGDSVNLINSAFAIAPPAEPLPEQAIWEEAWVWSVAKQAGGVALVILLALMVLRPLLKNLATVQPQRAMIPVQGAEAQMMAGGDQMGAAGMPAQLAGPNDYESQLNSAKELVSQDPKRVAQVVKTWVAGENG